MLTLRELRSLAKQQMLKGYSSMKKRQLMTLLDVKPSPTVKELKAQAKERGLRGYSRLRKSQLIDLLDGKLTQQVPRQDTVKNEPKSQPIVVDKKGKPEDLEFVPSDHKVGKYLRSWTMNVDVDAKDQSAFLNDVKPTLAKKIEDEMKDLGGIKYQLAVLSTLSKEDSTDEVKPYFRCKQTVITESSDISPSLENAFQVMQESLERFTHRGSGFSLDGVERLHLDIANYIPLKGGSYIDLPAYYKNKKAIVNVKNNDDQCLRWALKSALFPAETHSDRTSSYPEEDGLDLNGIDAPTPLSQIKKVEKQNNLAINVFGNTTETQGVIVHRISSAPGRLINLFLLEKEGKYHYTWIKNFNRLMYDQTAYGGKKYFCERCLHGYCRSDLLESHKPDCKGVGETAVRIDMPEKGKNILSFQNYQNQMASPYIIYADFESLTLKVDSVVPDKDKSYTLTTQKHEACGFGYVVVRSDGQTNDPVIYRGKNAAEEFLQTLQQEEKKIRTDLTKKKAMILTEEDKADFEAAKSCWICTKPLAGKKLKGGLVDSKVRDHDHITGKYRGAAHGSCNLQLSITPDEVVIPVVFHNLRGYDSHIIMQAISKVKGDINCIPNNMEKYLSFSLGKLRFIDSAQFLLSSLDNLVSANKPEQFKIMNTYSEEATRSLLVRKGVYCYDYMDDWSRFDETQLPPMESFYNAMTDSEISAEEYKHAQKVWDTFGCKTLGEYHDLYLKTDVLLLADVFEIFRKTCMNQYGLDPAHYYTSPGLSWDALLKKTNVRLRLLTDYDMHLFIEKGLRGGISMSSKRYAKANNQFVEGYDPAQPSNHILYLDANNLYGWAMSQALPTGGFEWVTPLSEQDIMNVPKDSEKGYILEVDLEYPSKLHKDHNSYPLAPERLMVDKKWMSDYQNNLINGPLAKVEKLVPNLMDKTKYIIHYRNLQLYLSLGMKLKAVHRVLKFDQSPWMEPYIRLNTDLRKKATSDFEKNLYKLMNNAVFGKTMENLRKRVDVKIVRGYEEKRLRKLIASPAFNRSKIFDEDLAALHMNKSHLYLNRPVYVGMSILDLSKHLMYDFYYNTLKKQYGDRCEVLYTDTDSLLLEIQTEDVYQDMLENIYLYDTSDYPQNSPLYNTANKKRLGKFKDECSGIPISEYVSLRPKMYSIMKSDQSEVKKAKGVKKYVVQKYIKHEQYKQALFSGKTLKHEMNLIRSVDHQLYTLRMNKTSLSPLDTKRWIDEDGITTYAYGYKFS